MFIHHFLLPQNYDAYFERGTDNESFESVVFLYILFLLSSVEKSSECHKYHQHCKKSETMTQDPKCQGINDKIDQT